MEPKKETKGKEEHEAREIGDLKETDLSEIKKMIDEEKRGMPSGVKQLITKLEEESKKVNQRDKTIEELTDTLKRLQAEFENYKKRADKERIEFMKYANAGVIAHLLPVIDSFDIALKSTADREKFIEGIKMIYAQLYSVLESEGLRPIKAIGEKFDPYRHEVLMKEESGKPEETILEEFQKGYMLNDRVLRHSKVKISGK